MVHQLLLIIAISFDVLSRPTRGPQRTPRNFNDMPLVLSFVEGSTCVRVSGDCSSEPHSRGAPASGADGQVSHIHDCSQQL